MQKKNEAEMKPAVSHVGFFVLRSPRYPVERLKTFLAKFVNVESGEARQALVEFFTEKEARHALALASPSLLNRLKELELSDKSCDEKVTLALAKYVIRMCTRATPFGLFSGLTIGDVAESTHFEVVSEAEYRAYAKLDCAFVSSLVDILLETPAKEAVGWYANPSLYELDGNFRYIERIPTSTGYGYNLAAVEATQTLKQILSMAQRGAKLHELRAQIRASEADASDSEIEEFLSDLSKSRLLISDLEPPPTGLPPHVHLERRMRDAEISSNLYDSLKEVSRHLENACSLPLSASIEAQEAAFYETARMGRVGNIGDALHVDLIKPAKRVNLSSADADQIARLSTILLGIDKPPVQELSEFRERFRERYDEQWVPLHQALDQENGVGFGHGRIDNPLVRGLPSTPNGSAVASDTAWTRLLTRKAESAWRSGKNEVEVSEVDLKACVGTNVEMAAGMHAFISVLRDSDVVPGAHSLRYLLNYAGGKCAIETIGRFCHSSEELHNKVVATAMKEQAASEPQLLASVSHWADYKGANVTIAPHLRQFEIRCSGHSSLTADNQIMPRDLLVAVRGSELLLYSTRHRRLIFPMINNMHSFFNSADTVYRFLGLLQLEKARMFHFMWPPYLIDAETLPRVRIENMILSPAMWRLSLPESTGSEKDVDRSVRRVIELLRTKHGMPRWVIFREGEDQTLTLDLDHELGMRLLARACSRNPKIMLEEAFIDEAACVEGPEGRFLNEVDLPLVKQAAVQRRLPQEELGLRLASRLEIAERAYFPGSKWLFIKVYGGEVAADRFLSTLARTAVEKLMPPGGHAIWFFVRYADPQPHIRLRFSLAEERTLHEITSTLLGETSSFKPWRIQLDTYYPEVERYGGPAAMEVCERMFHKDSKCVLSILEEISSFDDESARWKAALFGVHMFMQDFDLPLMKRRDMLKRAIGGYCDQFKLSREFMTGVATRFRKLRAELLDLLFNGVSGDFGTEKWMTPIRARSTEWQNEIKELNALASSKSLNRPLEEIIISQVHMSLNRLLLPLAIPQEVAIYEFLQRLYESIEKRSG